MIRFQAIVIRVIKELIRDKRTLALMLIAPIIVLSLMNIVFDSNSETHVKIGFDQTVPSILVDQFSSDEVKVEHYTTNRNYKEKILNENLDAFVTLDQSTFHITYANDEPTNTAKVKGLVQNVLTANKVKRTQFECPKISSRNRAKSNHRRFFSAKFLYLWWSKQFLFDQIFPILIGFCFLFCIFSFWYCLVERTHQWDFGKIASYTGQA